MTGEARGSQQPVGGHLFVRRSRVGGATAWKAGWTSVFDRVGASVAGDLGSDLGGGHVIVLGFVVTV